MSGGYVGVVGGKLAPVVLHPDECLYRPGLVGPLRCLRPGHPTAGSHCSEGWRTPMFLAPPDTDPQETEPWQ